VQIKDNIHTLAYKVQAWKVSHWMWAATLILVLLIFNLVTLLQYPVVSVDEGWNANRSWGLLQTGRAFGTMDAGPYENFPGYWTFYPWTGAWLHSLSMSVFGPDLFSIRFVSFIFGAVLLLSIYVLGKQLYDSAVGLIAVVLLSFSQPFLYSSHIGRHDIIVATLGFGAVTLYFISRSAITTVRAISLSVISGLLIGLTLDIHPNGIIFVPVILSLFALDFGFAAIKQLRLWGFLAGLVLGVAFFVLMHLVQYPETYFAIAELGNPTSRTPPILELNPRGWLIAIVGTGALFLDDWRSPLIMMAIIMLFYRRLDADKKVLVLSAALLLTFAAVVRYHAPHYAILITPVGDLLTAAFLYRIYKERSQVLSLRGYAATAVIWGLIGASVIANLDPVLNNTRREYEFISGELRRVIPSGSSVLGSPIYGFVHPRDPYYGPHQLVYYQRYNPGSTLDQALQHYAPDYVIVSENKEYDLFLSPVLRRWTRIYIGPDVSNQDLEEIASKNGHLIGTLDTRWFGYLHLYKMDWKDLDK
jgi:4-amino-4-deoxy-L-arabinose transferase-like glycosyltransferase